MYSIRVFLVLIFTATIISLSAFTGFTVDYSQPGYDQHILSFDLGDFDLRTVRVNGTLYTQLVFDHSIFTRDKGYAQLPYLNATIAIPDDRNVELSIIPVGYEEFQLNEPLLPSRGVIYRNQDPDLIPYEIDPASLQDEWYPGNLATITEPFIIRDIRGVSIYTYPFQYNAARNILRVYSSIDIYLQENDEVPVNPLLKKDNSIQREMDGIYRSVFLNYDITRDELTIGDHGDILVFCTTRDEDVIQPYIDWKREKGFQVFLEIVAVGTNVKTMIQDQYDLNNDILYVLLVGDWNDIKSDTMGWDAPMDPQLGCVVGDDEFPDITIGRFSASSPSHVTTQVNKVIDYEKLPDLVDDWYAYATGVASNLGPGDDNEYDNQHNDVIWEDKLDPFTYDYYNAIYDPAANASMVSNAVNTGTSLINYTGHGSMTSWGSSGFSNTHVNALSNGNKLPWIVSVACNNGEFQSGECFTEAWVKKEGGGAIAFLGSTVGQPWDPPMRGQDYFMDVHIGGYNYDEHPGQNGINTEELRTFLGPIIFNGLVLMTTESSGYDDWETAKTWTLFGDPALQVRSCVPGDLVVNNQIILVGTPYETTITLDGDLLEGAMVALSQDDLYYCAITDGNGIVSIPNELLPGTALLVVTAFNAETFYQDIEVIPPSGPYVIYDSHVINDGGGNVNGQADYGESVTLDFQMKNVGVDTAYNVEVQIISDDDYVFLTDDSENFGDIDPGQSVSIEDAFALYFANDVPDNHSILFTVAANDGANNWLSNFSITVHAPILTYSGYTINDSAGNNNGKLDPGETAEIIVSITNDGSSTAYNVYGLLNTPSEYITINSSNLLFGDLAPDVELQQAFSVTADAETPAGYSVQFSIYLSADMGITGEGSFFTIVGQVPICVLELDGYNSSAADIQNCLDNLNVGYDICTEIPEDPELYTSIFVLLGVYNWEGSHVLTNGEGQTLANYLNAGGMIYMEGGDTWYFDSQTLLQPLFNIDGTADGSGDLSTILGQNGTFTEDMMYNYSGDNSFVDHISAIPPADLIFMNASPSYGCGVAYDAGTYKTIGVSFEFGGLDDGVDTKDELMAAYLDFFGIDYYQVDTGDEIIAPLATDLLQNYPNPFNPSTTVHYSLKNPEQVNIEIFNIRGQRVATLVDQYQDYGEYSVTWYGKDNNDRDVSSGVYFIKMKAGRYTSTKKMLLMK